MPSYLDFDATKRFRDEVLKRTLDPVYGKGPSPKTFTNSNYSVNNLNDVANINQPNVDFNRDTELTNIKNKNTFKPEEYIITEDVRDLPRQHNLSLYPYFTFTEHNLIGIMSNRNFDTESELFKFAAYYIKNNSQGPVFSRIQQNLISNTTGKLKVLDAINGNSAVLSGIIKGTTPLIEGNNKITVAKSLLGKGIDFLQTVSGTQLPWTEIPGDYLTNPRNPVNTRPTNVNDATKVWQDLTGTLGSFIGIRRRPLPTRKPSDLFIEYMGESTKSRLFDLLRYSKYAPNYTTTARSQQSTRLFNFPNQIGQGIKNVLGLEAPDSVAYIGDDRGNDVKNVTSDLLSGRKVKSSYYLSLLFDPVATELFHSEKQYSNQGGTSGKLTWISNNRKTGKLDETKIAGTLSTAYDFREDSILYITQDILNSKPDNGGEALSHVANVIDQTTKYFKEGDTLISRGSAVKYIDNSGRDIGVEYSRVWTKDRPYYTFKDSAPYYSETTDLPFYKKTATPYRRTNIRRYEGSVLSNTWNLNIAPMSNGNKGFDNSTNIVPGENGFYAKKYMFSIENLAWKSSTLSGFTVSDLPYCERGSNGGRVMWFPPYDLKVSEQNSARWDSNTFLGRPEPIYTYQSTERSGQVSFKIVVDHPSVLNLLVREHFKNMNEEQVDEYIASFFAGAKDIDFYSLIRTYTNLEPDDVKLIQQYLNSSTDKNLIKEQKKNIQSQVVENPEETTTQKANNTTVSSKVTLYFPNNTPTKLPGNAEYVSSDTYDKVFSNEMSGIKDGVINELSTALNSIITNSSTKDIEDRITIFQNQNITVDSIPNITGKTSSILDENQINQSKFTTDLNTLKTNLENGLVKGDVTIIIDSAASSPADEDYNISLSLRRSHSLVKQINSVLGGKDKWNIDLTNFSGTSFKYDLGYSFKELNFEKQKTGNLIIKTTSYGENAITSAGDCSKIKYNKKELAQFSPSSYGCRQSNVTISYETNTNNDKSNTNNDITLTKIQTANKTNIQNKNRPPIDVMKRIIMKTLSECYYFKKLEETSPLVFNSLKEKLRYFHPGFHSTTPEGLNARLTFLQQCLRPGNTIPIKGIADDSDLNARNTSFGPPPICVLRVGDFYHSKIVIRDLNITYDDGVWDMNPEGIGIQPMIATVTLQINFIGGQGLEKPIEKLQNALSSNFYANTEMYDERSIPTYANDEDRKKRDKFTKEFLEDLQNDYLKQSELKSALGQDFKEGQFLGTLSGSTSLSLVYNNLIDDLYKFTSNYFNTYESMYNELQKTFSKELSRFMIDKTYRKIIKYDVFTGLTSSKEIELFGLHEETFDMGIIATATKNELTSFITKDNIISLYQLDSDLTPNVKNDIAEILYNYTIKEISNLLDSTTTKKIISDFEVNRDKIINTLDKLNFITEHGYDVKIDRGNSIKADLSIISGDTSSFYNEYSACVDYLNDNVGKFYDKIDTSINFETLDFTEDVVSSIISQIFSDKKSVIIGRINYETEGLTGNKIDETIMKSIDNSLSSFLKEPKQVNFKFKKLPIRNNNNTIAYNINQSTTTTTEQIKNLFKTKYKVTKASDKLNYYKK